MKYLFIVLMNLSALSIVAQDSLMVFSYASFIEVVKKHHPIVYKAGLKSNEGNWHVTKSRGGFDPKLKGSATQKYFDSKQYYSYVNGSLVIPTWFGMTLNGGYSNNDGVLLNSESYTGPEGVWNAGLNINLGKGLFIDQRRADLKQAEYLKSNTLLEQKLILNQLHYDASIAYFEWLKAYNKLTIYKNGVLNAKERLINVNESVINGDKPAVDTLKASIQLQDRKLKLIQAVVTEENKRMWLNTFLWQDGFVPLEIDSLVQPVIEIELLYNQLSELDKLVENHPEIVMYNNDIEMSRIDYRLKKENLKPTVQLKYNALSNDRIYNVEDYNWGAKVSYPIFTRKERASVKLSQLKVEQKNMSFVTKKAQVKYKIEASFNQLLSTNKQILIQEKATAMYKQLFDAEKTLFDIGESSLFMVNIREQNLIKSQVKLIDVNYQQQLAKTVYNYHLVNY